MNIEVRKANILDVNHIVEIDVKTSKETYDGIMPQEYLEGRLYKIDKIKNKVRERINNNYDYIVILVDNKIVGYSLYLVSNNKVYLDSLYLLKKYHNLGLGKKLLLSTISDIVIKGYNSMYLYCAKENKACKFYEYMGANKIDNISYKINDFIVDSIIYEFNDLKIILNNNVKVLNLK